MIKNLLWLCFVPFLFFSCQQENKYPRVIVLGLDGMRPDGIENAYTPNLHRLIQEGTSTMNGRAVYPTSSGANWSSMVLGAGPDQHGIDRNDWLLENRNILPVYEKPNGYFPSVFDVLKNKYPDLRCSAVLDWYPVAHYFDSTIPDTIIDTDSTAEVIDNILAEVLEIDAKFIFTQIDQMDYAGHSTGYGSEAYLKDAEELDKEIGRLIEGLKENELYEDTYILVISDHGGIGKGHGNKTMEEYEVPFIIRGPGVMQGKSTTEPVMPYDIAATVVSVFNCEIPPFWIGTNVESAFGKHPELLSDFAPRPQIHVDSVNEQFSFVSCLVKNGEFDIKYKMSNDINDPWVNYKEQLILPHGDTLFTCVVPEEKLMKNPFYSKPYLNHKGINSVVTLKNEPSDKYKANGAKSLTDGFIAKSATFSEYEWLGFQENDLIATFDFQKEKDINSIEVRCIENINSWIFLPKSVVVSISENGKGFKEVIKFEIPDKMNIKDVEVNSWELELEDIHTRFLKVNIEKFGTLPEWHSGAGKQAWLFVDEIIMK